MNKVLFLLRGPPGSGKTTTANLLSENGKYPVLSADMFFEDENGNYNWDASRIKEAHTWCINAVEENMKLYEGLRIIHEGIFQYRPSRPIKIFVANTFTQEWEMEDYFKLAKEYGYNVVSLICENRHDGKNIHDVPNETLTKMKERFQIKLLYS